VTLCLCLFDSRPHGVFAKQPWTGVPMASMVLVFSALPAPTTADSVPAANLSHALRLPKSDPCNHLQRKNLGGRLPLTQLNRVQNWEVHFRSGNGTAPRKRDRRPPRLCSEPLPRPSTVKDAPRASAAAENGVPKSESPSRGREEALPIHTAAGSTSSMNSYPRLEV